jgi:hypothetical protein
MEKLYDPLMTADVFENENRNLIKHFSTWTPYQNMARVCSSQVGRKHYFLDRPILKILQKWT